MSCCKASTMIPRVPIPGREGPAPARSRSATQPAASSDRLPTWGGRRRGPASWGPAPHAWPARAVGWCAPGQQLAQPGMLVVRSASWLSVLVRISTRWHARQGRAGIVGLKIQACLLMPKACRSSTPVLAAPARRGWTWDSGGAIGYVEVQRHAADVVADRLVDSPTHAVISELWRPSAIRGNTPHSRSPSSGTTRRRDRRVRAARGHRRGTANHRRHDPEGAHPGGATPVHLTHRTLIKARLAQGGP